MKKRRAFLNGFEPKFDKKWDSKKKTLKRKNSPLKNKSPKFLTQPCNPHTQVIYSIPKITRSSASYYFVFFWTPK